MRRFFISKLIAALLAFIIGLAAYEIWNRRQRIIDVCTELLMNYQD